MNLRSTGLIISLVALASLAQGQDNAPVPDEVRLVQGLRTRGLFKLADTFCSEQLLRKEIDPVLQADLVVEQILIRTASAISSGDSDGNGWGTATEPGQMLLAKFPEHPRRLLVEFQILLVTSARAQSIRRNVQFGLEPDSSLVTVINLYEQCQRELEKLQKSITEAMPQALQRAGTGSELSTDRLQSLSASANFQTAVCLHALAELYETRDHLNRVDALNLVFEKLEAVRRQTGKTSDLNHSCELLRIEALRSAGKIGEAQRALQELDIRQLSAANRQKYWQQELAQTAAGSGDGRINKTIESIQKEQSNWPETEIAVLEYMASPAAQKSNAFDLTVLRDWTARIQTRFGTGWGRVGERILLNIAGESGMAETNPEGVELAVDLAIRSARNAFQEKRFDEALQGFRNAAAALEPAAKSDSQIVLAFKLRAQIAELLANRGDFSEAARELRDVSQRFASHSLAPTIHRRACWYADPTRNAKGGDELYLEYTNNQIARWNNADATDEIRLELSIRFWQRADWNAVVDLLLQISPERRTAGDGAVSLGKAFENWLQSLSPADGNATGGRFAPRIRDYAQGLVTGSIIENIDEGWQLIVTLDNLGLKYGFVAPEKVLIDMNPLFQPLEGIEDDTLTRGLTTLMAAQILGPGESDAMESVLKRIESSAGFAAEVIELLEQTGARDFRDQKRQVLEFQLKLAEQVSGMNHGAVQTKSLQFSTAKLLLALEKPVEATEILKVLAEQYPDDIAVQLGYARLVSRNPKSLPIAIATWRKIGARLAPQSEPWFESKHETARLLLENTQVGEAKQMLEFLKAVPPGWNESEWRERLDQLLSKCQREVDQ